MKKNMIGKNKKKTQHTYIDKYQSHGTKTVCIYDQYTKTES